MEEGDYMSMVPFLTVLKGDEVVDKINLEGRDCLIMGRHHSCDLVVAHASSSRRHLEIQIISSTRDIILTDLGSVHGTWVDGVRLDFMIPTVYNASVTFQLAASTRVYRMDWQSVPFYQELSQSSEAGGKEKTVAPTVAPPPPPTERPNPKIQDANGKTNAYVNPTKVGDKFFGSIVQEQDENLSPAFLNSPGLKHSQMHKTVAVSSSPKLPMRRLAFSALQTSGNRPLPRPQTPKSSSPSVKKGLAERGAHNQTLSKSQSFEKVHTSPNKQLIVGTVDSSTPSKLWLRRGSSAPLPALTTLSSDTKVNTSRSKAAPSAPPLSAIVENEQHELRESMSGPMASNSGVSDKVKKSCVTSKYSGDEEEGYPSDKENVDPVRLPYIPLLLSKDSSATKCVSKDDSSSIVETIERQPFKPLFNPLPCTAVGYRGVFQSTADSYNSYDEDYNFNRALSLTRPQQKHCPTAENLDQLLRRLKLADSIEGRKQWHAVIDTNCLLDAESLKALKQLEGIKEVSVIIPKIVVRELDFLKHRDGLRSSAREALKWIESCMLRIPKWIHVQKASETLPVGVTPPPSPSLAFPNHSDLMSPTNDDHILECAMLFEMTIHYGKVALLTRDTALRIKAMSEGLLSESAIEFVESLLSPYSNRFLWAGSTAHGKTWVDLPGSEAAPRPRPHNHQPREELRNHISAQPRGLQVAVSQ